MIGAESNRKEPLALCGFGMLLFMSGDITERCWRYFGNASPRGFGMQPSTRALRINWGPERILRYFCAKFLGLSQVAIYELGARADPVDESVAQVRETPRLLGGSRPLTALPWKVRVDSAKEHVDHFSPKLHTRPAMPTLYIADFLGATGQLVRLAPFRRPALYMKAGLLFL